jgi:hypothetical protein
MVVVMMMVAMVVMVLVMKIKIFTTFCFPDHKHKKNKKNEKEATETGREEVTLEMVVDAEQFFHPTGMPDGVTEKKSGTSNMHNKLNGGTS